MNMTRTEVSHLAGVVVLGLLLIPAMARGQAPAPVGEDAVHHRLQGMVAGILKAWDVADVVCLGEGHGSKNDSDLRIALIQHPEFVRKVDTIVVEFANPAHHAVLDRLVLEGQPLSRDVLSIVWRDTSGAEVWESPVYEQFLRAVSRVNLTLPSTRRVRVIGADKNVPNRGRSFREVVSEVLDKKLKALAIVGARHCERRGGGFPGELEGQYPGRLWSAFTFYGDDAVREARSVFGLGREPQLIQIVGTVHAGKPAVKMFFTGHFTDTATLGDIADAIVYYGDMKDVIIRPAKRMRGHEPLETRLTKR